MFHFPSCLMICLYSKSRQADRKTFSNCIVWTLWHVWQTRQCQLWQVLHCHKENTEHTLQVWPKQICHWMGQKQGIQFDLNRVERTILQTKRKMCGANKRDCGFQVRSKGLMKKICFGYSLVSLRKKKKKKCLVVYFIYILRYFKSHSTSMSLLSAGIGLYGKLRQLLWNDLKLLYWGNWVTCWFPAT